MNWLCLGKPDWDQHPESIDDAAKHKPIGISPHGSLNDRLHRQKKYTVLVFVAIVAPCKVSLKLLMSIIRSIGPRKEPQSWLRRRLWSFTPRWPSRASLSRRRIPYAPEPLRLCAFAACYRSPYSRKGPLDICMPMWFS